MDYCTYEHGCISDCCGSEIKWGDICCSCGEHCTPIEEGKCLNCGDECNDEFCCNDCRKIYYE